MSRVQSDVPSNDAVAQKSLSVQVEVCDDTKDFKPVEMSHETSPITSPLYPSAQRLTEHVGDSAEISQREAPLGKESTSIVFLHISRHVGEAPANLPFVSACKHSKGVRTSGAAAHQKCV